MKLIIKLIITILFAISSVSFGSSIIQEEIKWTIPNMVTMTVYTINKYTVKPARTASGILLNKINPKKHKIIAISRDLLGKYNFGDRVLIVGAGKHDGEYFVEDLMHERFKNKIDILINPNDKLTKLYNIKMYKL